MSIDPPETWNDKGACLKIREKGGDMKKTVFIIRGGGDPDVGIPDVEASVTIEENLPEVTEEYINDWKEKLSDFYDLPQKFIKTGEEYATFQEQKTLSQVKANLDCIEYKEGISWKQISEKLNSPDIAPIPEPDNLSKNTRIYSDKTIIFYTELKEVKKGSKVRFYEIVNKIELCK